MQESASILIEVFENIILIHEIIIVFFHMSVHYIFKVREVN